MIPPRFAIALGLVSLLAASARSTEPLAAKVAAVIETPAYVNAHWGLLVVDSTTGKIVYEKNADRLFCPASVTKLYSTAAAIVDLGPDYTFQTPVVRRGHLDGDGVLHGDLILVASGDLSLGGRTGSGNTLLFEDNDHIYSSGGLSGTLVPVDPLSGLDMLAQGVLGAGVKAVEGDILIDDRLYELSPSSGSGPARVSPIMVNDNIVDVVVTPAAKAGDLATVRIVPDTNFVSMDARVDTVAETETGSITVQNVGHRAFAVRGKAPVGHKPIVKIHSVEEPASYARALFIETLRRRGVKVGASPQGSNRPENLPTRSEVAALPKLATYTSPPLTEFIKVILKVSHNPQASALPLLIASHHAETTLRQGLSHQGKILKGLGVDTSTIAFGGGAGGAREDLTTPRATVALLRGMASRPDYPSYESAFPVLGKDGTLAKAVAVDSPARGHVRAKTGTYWVDNALTGKSVLTSKALAGTMETASGRKLTFAFFLNNVAINGPVSEATAAAGRLLGRLSEVFYNDKDNVAEAAGSAASRKD